MSVREYARAMGISSGVVCVLSAALDASRCNPPWLYTVAGYVARPDAWDAVLARWREALAGWKMERFHLTELPYYVGSENARMVERYFARIIEESDLHAVGAALFEEDWCEADWGPDKSPRMNSPYEQSLWFALKSLGGYCARKFPGEEVAVVCDVDAPEASIQKVFSLVQERSDNLHSLAVSSSRKFKALECADLAAGTLRKTWLDICDNNDSDLSWGVMPHPKGKYTSSVWSLRQGAILTRSLRMHEARAKAWLAKRSQISEDDPDVGA